MAEQSVRDERRWLGRDEDEVGRPPKQRFHLGEIGEDLHPLLFRPAVGVRGARHQALDEDLCGRRDRYWARSLTTSASLPDYRRPDAPDARARRERSFVVFMCPMAWRRTGYARWSTEGR